MINSDRILEVLELVDSVFPLPDDPSFRGHHALTRTKHLDRMMLGLMIWFKNNFGQIVYRDIFFEGEEITRELLENEIKPFITECMNTKLESNPLCAAHVENNES